MIWIWFLSFLTKGPYSSCPKHCTCCIGSIMMMWYRGTSTVLVLHHHSDNHLMNSYWTNFCCDIII